jgi:molybdenum-dependent DNA-binding transcriptional regulator ModE
MRTRVRTELLDNKNFDRGRNTLLSVIHVEKSLMKTGKEIE